MRGGSTGRGRVSLSVPQSSIAVNAGEIKNIFHFAKLIRSVDHNPHIGSINIHLVIKTSGLLCVDSRLVLDRIFAAC